jgi:8-oxo-dGTP pyrophosphatase MutT (NUDIX family)
LTREVWKPNVTVAAVCEKDGKFLLVEEETEDGLRINQPAGHLEPGEALVDAVIRETFEETAFNFQPEYLVGVYSWRQAARDVTYLRFAFAGKVTFHDATRTLDKGIVRALWLGADEIRASVSHHRSPLLMRCVDDFRAGHRFPLDLLVHYA